MGGRLRAAARAGVRARVRRAGVVGAHAARPGHHHTGGGHGERAPARPHLRPPLAFLAEPRGHPRHELGAAGRRDRHSAAEGHQCAAADRSGVDGPDQAALSHRAAAAEGSGHPPLPGRQSAERLHRRRAGAAAGPRADLGADFDGAETDGGGHRTDYHDRPHRDIHAGGGHRLRLIAGAGDRAADHASHRAGDRGDRAATAH